MSRATSLVTKSKASLTMPRQSKLKDAIDSGKISYKELEGIIRRFQDYENNVISGDRDPDKLESAEGL